MRAKVLILALLAAVIALPAPASQFLAGTFAASTPASAAASGAGRLGLLLQDPFLVDQMSFAAPARVSETDPDRA